jgi:hypothetical protein
LSDHHAFLWGQRSTTDIASVNHMMTSKSEAAPAAKGMNSLAASVMRHYCMLLAHKHE